MLIGAITGNNSSSNPKTLPSSRAHFHCGFSSLKNKQTCLNVECVFICKTLQRVGSSDVGWRLKCSCFVAVPAFITQLRYALLYQPDVALGRMSGLIIDEQQ